MERGEKSREQGYLGRGGGREDMRFLLFSHNYLLIEEMTKAQLVTVEERNAGSVNFFYYKSYFKRHVERREGEGGKRRERRSGKRKMRTA
jgi:hypothetical protein